MKILDTENMTTKELLVYLREYGEKYELPFTYEAVVDELIERLDNGEDIDCDDCEMNELYCEEDETGSDLTDLLTEAVTNCNQLDVVTAYVDGVNDTANRIREFISAVAYSEDDL